MKILLIDNHKLFCDGVRCILQELDGTPVSILEAGCLAEGLDMAGLHPDMDAVLLEPNLPGEKGTAAIRKLRRMLPRVPLLIVSADEDCRQMKAMLNSGADGFVCKSSGGEVLLDALGKVLAGSTYAPQQLFRQAERKSDAGRPPAETLQPAGSHGLTPRQLEMFGYLVAGMSNKEIAAAANISAGTVKTHLAMLYRTLGIKKRVEALRFAGKLGFAVEGKFAAGENGSRKGEGRIGAL